MPRPFTDHHVHFLATVASRASIDVSGARSIPELLDVLHAGAGGRPPGWVRAWGYEETRLAEDRHPTRFDLDRAVPGRPAVLHHRTGHAAVLSSHALLEVGAGDHPDGVLFDRHDLLARVPRLDQRVMTRLAEAVSREWERAGVASFVDATHTNGPDELALLDRWRSAGVVRQEVTAMVAPGHLDRLPPFGDRLGSIVVGHVKLMPGPVAVSVEAAHRAGFPVALHAVEIDHVEGFLEALSRSHAPEGTADRLEHNALCLPEQIPRLAATGARVVLNPSFLLHRGDRYRRLLSPVEQEWLVPIRSLLEAGMDVRAGSDSPVTPSRPDEMVAAALRHPFRPSESVTREEAEALLRA